MKKKMKQSTMISILGFAAILLLVGVVISFSINSYFNRRIDSANTSRYELTYNANRFMNGSSYLTNEVRAYAATGDTSHYDNYWNEINNLKNRDIGVENMRAIGITAEEDDMIEQMSSLSNELVPLEEKAMEDVKIGEIDAAIEYVYGSQYSDSIAQISQIKTSFLDTLDQRTAGEVKRLSGTVSTLNLLVWFFIIISVVIQVLATIYNRKSIIRPIIRVQQEMGKVAQGELSSSFDLEPDTSEIGRLVDAIHSTKKTLRQYIGDISETLSHMAKGNMAQRVEMEYIGDFKPIQAALNTILDSFNRTLGQINQSAYQVSAGSQQVAQSSQSLAQGATEQASSVEEISATVSLLDKQMEEVADNANKARAGTDAASEAISQSNAKMRELTSAMQDISEASVEIGKIIDTIENIAFQTNILALNAAVEAARAGVAGKGFAVVADEVRNLANKSQEASQNTAALIERSLSAVRSGTKLTDETAKTLLGMEESYEQATAFVRQIAESTREQAQALGQLTDGVDQISSVVQTNSATSEESAAAAEELSAQAITLQELVGEFKLRGGEAEQDDRIS